MRDDSSTGHAEISALAHQVATARGKLPLQHDNALLEVLSDGEVAAERELAEWIRAQRRGQRRRAMQDELDAEKRDRRADAALRRADESDARWHRKALAARRRVASQDARIAQLYRRAEWSSRALIAVVVLGMVWAGVNVQRNLVPSGDMSDPLYWLSYGIEAMISIPIIVIMIAATTAARWGRELPRGRVILVELALLGTTIGLNAGPHLAAGELGRAAEFAIAPIMVGVVIWLHSWVAARYAQLIDDASVDLPIDSMVEAPAAPTRAFTERYPAPQGEVDLAELVARANAEFERMGIESTRSGVGEVAPQETAVRAVPDELPVTSTPPSDVPAAPEALEQGQTDHAATGGAAARIIADAVPISAAAPVADARVVLPEAVTSLPDNTAQTGPEQPQAAAASPTAQLSGQSPAQAGDRDVAQRNGFEHPTAPQPDRNGSTQPPTAPEEAHVAPRSTEIGEAEPPTPPARSETESLAPEQSRTRVQQDHAQTAIAAEPSSTPPRTHLRAVTVPEPPKQEPLPVTEAQAEPDYTAATAEPKELTSALTTNEPEPALPDHDPVIESDEAGAWAAAKTIVARGWSKVPVEQLAEILEMADRSRSAASIGAEMGLPRSVVDQAMQAAHKLSRTYAMTS
ncbi:hypothetical protein AB0H71_12650 [Nocardia sp. NPDC050697]|uniref:hypothetical protein n=1 Tax=Nocardia sp. NPDC050697 TaxID=3155158 RepID=UPI0033C2748F